MECRLFFKPVKAKAFTGKTISSIADLVGCGNYSENYEVFVSNPIDIVAEWQCFLYYDDILDVRPYGALAEPNTRHYLYHYDSSILNQMLAAFRTWEERPAACSMDICVTKNGQTLLIECNDAYSLGCYGLAPIFYAKFISARWSQLLKRKDEYDFR